MKPVMRKIKSMRATIGPWHGGIHRHRGPDRRRRHRRMPCRISAHCMEMKHSPFFDTGRRQIRRARRGTERTPRRMAANCRNEWSSNGQCGLIPTLKCLQTCPPASLEQVCACPIAFAARPGHCDKVVLGFSATSLNSVHTGTPASHHTWPSGAAIPDVHSGNDGAMQAGRVLAVKIAGINVYTLPTKAAEKLTVLGKLDEVIHRGKNAMACTG